jgi:hypothetical protein
MPVRKTARGKYLFIHPNYDDDTWVLVSFDGNGNWSSMSHYATKEEAKAALKERRAWHKKLAMETAARSKARRGI